MTADLILQTLEENQLIIYTDRYTKLSVNNSGANMKKQTAFSTTAGGGKSGLWANNFPADNPFNADLAKKPYTGIDGVFNYGDGHQNVCSVPGAVCRNANGSVDIYLFVPPNSAFDGSGNLSFSFTIDRSLDE